MSKDEKEWKACDIETASDTLRAGGESAVKSVENWLKVDGEMGTVSVRVKFGVGSVHSLYTMAILGQGSH